ncbi:ATP-dependent helicase [Teichococcus aestuarii]|uniref:ATP-dependent helicase n=1 Tax=Teichococcus aestuarii TaxID=568898 RepID=UPI00361A0978
MTETLSHLAGLNEAQAAAAMATAPQLVLAGAGSGKTETLTRRVADLILRRGEAPERLLCITFTTKAAGEMRARLAARLGAGRVPRWVGTFHAVMARLMTEEASQVPGLPRGFAILGQSDARAVLMALAGLKDAREGMALQDAVSLLKGSLLGARDACPQGPAFARFEAETLRQAQALLPAYRAELDRRAALDFDDLITRPVEAMQADRALAQRWGTRWSELLIDEYQDTNLAQHRLIRLLAGEQGRVFAVGDDTQSIYGWRGADVSQIRRFRRQYPGAGETIRLEINYRSARAILLAANAVAARDPQALRKTLRPARPDANWGTPLLLREAETPEQEGRAVVKHLQALRTGEEGLPWRECAVLLRAGFLAEPILAALAEAGMPFRRVSEREPEVPRDILAAQAWLQLAMSHDGHGWNAAADDAFRRACAHPPRGISGRLFAQLRQHAAETGLALAAAAEDLPGSDEDRLRLRAVADQARALAADIHRRRLPPEDALQLAAERAGLAAGLREAGQAHLAAWEAAFSAAGRFGSPAAYCEATALGEAADADLQADAVPVMTLHRAKGLEFDHVLMPGLEDGVFPSYRAEAQGSLAEERRLFYVGLTRARRSLWLSWVRHRRDWAAKPSRFLAEIPEQLFKGPPGAGAPPGPVKRTLPPPTQAETDRLVAEFHARRKPPGSGRRRGEG